MAEIPMHYQTSYEWQGNASEGVVNTEYQNALQVGTPFDHDRFSPEHMLVATAEACMANYVLLIAGMSKLAIKGYRSSAEGELEFEKKAGYRFKKILIRPELTVDTGSEALAEKVLDKAHRACLIARSLSCAVDIEPIIHA